MKQLILTFFAVLLCYCLFFDNEKKKKTVTADVKVEKKEIYSPLLGSEVLPTDLYNLNRAITSFTYLKVSSPRR